MGKLCTVLLEAICSHWITVVGKPKHRLLIILEHGDVEAPIQRHGFKKPVCSPIMRDQVCHLVVSLEPEVIELRGDLIDVLCRHCDIHVPQIDEQFAAAVLAHSADHFKSHRLCLLDVDRTVGRHQQYFPFFYEKHVVPHDS